MASKMSMLGLGELWGDKSIRLDSELPTYKIVLTCVSCPDKVERSIPTKIHRHISEIPVLSKNSKSNLDKFPL